MKISRNVLAWGVACGSVVLLSGGILAHQFNPQPDPPGHYFGLISVQRGQHVAVHVANRKMPVTRVSNNDACRAELHLVNARGADVAKRQGRVLPGQSMSLNFTADPPGEADPPAEAPTADPPGEIDPPDPDHVLLRAFVLFTGDAAHCLSSVEVIDAAGRTAAYLNPGSIVGANLQADRPGDIRR